LKNHERFKEQPLESFTSPIAQLLGIKVVEFGQGRAVLEMEAGPQHANPMGTLHGGILCDVGDLAMGMGCWTTLEEGESFTTLELKVNYLKPVWTGVLRATARIKKAGRTTALIECDVHDAQGALVAYMTSTCLVLRGEMAKGR
jgi:uncharacterized protein (TIGR00369 family)